MRTGNRLLTFLSVVVFCTALGSLCLANELDLSFEQADYAQIFRILGESQGLNVLVDPDVTGQGTFQLKESVSGRHLSLLLVTAAMPTV